MFIHQIGYKFHKHLARLPMSKSSPKKYHQSLYRHSNSQIKSNFLDRIRNGGLPNIGNTCFLNSALQFLYGSIKLRDFLFKLPSENMNSQASYYQNSQASLSVLLKKIFKGIYQEQQYYKKQKYIQNFIQRLAIIDDDYKVFRQDDSFRLILLILNELIQENPEVKSIFSVYYKNYCKICGFSIKMNEYFIINQKLTCNKCGRVMQIHLITPPSNIIFKGQHSQPKKILKSARRGQQSYQYQLVAKILYSGSGRFGHYKAIRKQKEGGQFLIYDDSIVSKATQQPYKMYYPSYYANDNKFQDKNISVHTSYSNRGIRSAYKSNNNYASSRYQDESQRYYCSKKCTMALYQQIFNNKICLNKLQNSLKQNHIKILGADSNGNIMNEKLKRQYQFKYKYSIQPKSILQLGQIQLSNTYNNQNIERKINIKENPVMPSINNLLSNRNSQTKYNQREKKLNDTDIGKALFKQIENKKKQKIKQILKKVKKVLEKCTQVINSLLAAKNLSNNSQFNQFLQENTCRKNDFEQNVLNKFANCIWNYEQIDTSKFFTYFTEILKQICRHFQIEQLFAYQVSCQCYSTNCRVRFQKQRQSGPIFNLMCHSCTKPWGYLQFKVLPRYLVLVIKPEQFENQKIVEKFYLSDKSYKKTVQIDCFKLRQDYYLYLLWQKQVNQTSQYRKKSIKNFNVQNNIINRPRSKYLQENQMFTITLRNQNTGDLTKKQIFDGDNLFKKVIQYYLAKNEMKGNVLFVKFGSTYCDSCRLQNQKIKQIITKLNQDNNKNSETPYLITMR